VFGIVGLCFAILLTGGCAGMPALQTPLAPPSTANPEPAAGPTAPIPATPATVAQPPQGSGDYNGIPVGFTPEGYPYRGSPDAPVTVQEFSDYLCPFCGRHVSQTEPGLLEQYVKTGQVRFIFRDYPIASLHPNAPEGHQAAQCVAEQGPVLYWKMHDQLFREQDQWRPLPDPAEYLAGAAKAAGADMTAYEACMASGRTISAVDKGVAEAQTLGYNGTPTFRLARAGSEKFYTLEGAQPIAVFNQLIDALVAGKEPPQEQQAAATKQELPFWAKPEGLAPDPEHPGFTMAGDPYKGNPQAKLVVVEFSDFQCPACRKHALEVQPAVDKEFVDTGKIQWVFKHLPLQAHPQAPTAAAAAECAGDQGKFWEMYHLLFEKADQWAVDDPDPALEKLAGELGLDTEAFSTCLAGRKALERVLGDMYDAKELTSETPTFVMLYGGSGRVMKGSLPYEQFMRALQGQLDQAVTGQ
jgi:protein-disulfide isomerase